MACISYNNICDGVADCPGSDDECLCEGSVHLRCTIKGRRQRVCVSQEKICKDELMLLRIGCKDWFTDDDIKCNKTATNPLLYKKDIVSALTIVNPVFECMSQVLQK